MQFAGFGVLPFCVVVLQMSFGMNRCSAYWRAVGLWRVAAEAILEESAHELRCAVGGSMLLHDDLGSSARNEEADCSSRDQGQRPDSQIFGGKHPVLENAGVVDCIVDLSIHSQHQGHMLEINSQTLK